MANDVDRPADAVPAGLLDSRYRVESVIGRGGMGTVYRALDTRLERPVAVKLLSDAPGAEEERFAAEVRTLARFAHPNLVRLLDAGEVDGRHYLVMELIEGPTLAARLTRGGLSGEATARVGAGAAGALGYVHHRGVVHRDVKPANILLDADGGAHIADFGIARLIDSAGVTVAGVTMGTPAYLAPEQVRGVEVGPPADVYALGLVLLECLSGERAFIGTTAEILAEKAQRGAVVPASVGTAWGGLLGAMTAVDPDQRPDMREVADHLSDRQQRWASVAPAVAAGVGVDDATRALGLVGGKTERISAAVARRARPRRSSAAKAATDAPTTAVAAATDAPTTAAPSAAPTGKRAARPTRVRRDVVAGAATVLAIVLIALAVSGVFSASPTAPATGETTVPPTTTTSLAPSASADATSVVSAIEAGVADGSITSGVGQQLGGLLQPIVSSTPATAAQFVPQYDQLVQAFDQDVASSAIQGSTTIGAVTGALTTLGTSLGTSMAAAAAVPTQPGGPGNSGHDHHDNGNGNGDGNGN